MPVVYEHDGTISDGPRDNEVNDACLSFRHDFGLLTKEEQNTLRFEAKEWLYAWGKTLKTAFTITFTEIKGM